MLHLAFHLALNINISWCIYTLPPPPPPPTDLHSLNKMQNMYTQSIFCILWCKKCKILH